MTTDPAPRVRQRRVLLIAELLLVGAVCCGVMWADFEQLGPAPLLQAGLVVAAAFVTVIPGVRRFAGRVIDRLRETSPAARRRTTLMIWVIASAYLAWTAHQQERDLAPRVHDEASYTIQARMVASGRLWQPQHPAADFFESFHLLVKPVYASIYWPGTALLNAPGVWAHWPSWVVPVLLTGLAIAMGYRVTAELADGLSGLLVALLMLATGRFRTFSTMVTAQIPALLLGLLVVWAYLHWRRTRSVGWAVAIGAFAGWSAITRPLDAVAFAAPVGLAMLLNLRSAGRRSAGSQALPQARWGTTIGAVVAGAVPFLALQGMFNQGVTGDPLRPPYLLYLEQSQPASVFGGGGHESVPNTDDAIETPDEAGANDLATQSTTAATTTETTRPSGSTTLTTLLQKQTYYINLLRDEEILKNRGWVAWISDRISQSVALTLPSPLLLVLLPVGTLGWAARSRWIVPAVVPLFLALYLFNPHFLSHYALPLTAAMAFWAVLGVNTLVTASASATYRRFVACFLTLAVVAIAASALPGLNPAIRDAAYGSPLLQQVDKSLSTIEGPAVVLFRYHPGSPTEEEPVYNTEVVWPDDGAIIRAHDLGPRNIELYRYYAALRPQTVFYLLDRGELMGHAPDDKPVLPTRLGTAEELVAGGMTNGGNDE